MSTGWIINSKKTPIPQGRKVAMWWSARKITWGFYDPGEYPPDGQPTFWADVHGRPPAQDDLPDE